MPWYAQAGSRRQESGKFRSYARAGVAKTPGHVHAYRDWTYDFVTHQTGSSVRRIRYSVSISDSNHNRAAYLRDFTSLAQAADAAKAWIDETLSRRLTLVTNATVGAIPSVPAATPVQEK